MEHETIILVFTAATIGFFHTILGPDHFIPFIVLGRARQWTIRKTLLITSLCGIGHVAGSVIIGIIGILLGTTLSGLVEIETSRGAIAAWMMIAFGLVYFIWGIRRAIRHKKHSHVHYHADGTTHSHTHKHLEEHLHPHERKNLKELTPWILFTIFVFGPCEPFIPLLLFPAANGNLTGILLVTATFTTITVLTMVTMVSLAHYSIKLIPLIKLEKYIHAIAGATILLCGISIEFLGL